MVTLSKQDQREMEKAKDLLETASETGFVRSLFFGRLQMQKLLPYPKQEAAEAARVETLLEALDAFMDKHVDPDRIDAEERIPDSVIRRLGELGVMGLTVPSEYGGGGFSHTAYCQVLERISRRCASTAVLVGAHQSIGLKALVLMGSEAQKHRWLPELASGRTLAAFCLSEPEVGSDAAGVQTRATLSEDGSHWIINGEKRYATNAALAGFLTVMARTQIEENGEKKEKVSAFIVTPDMPGFEIVSPNRSKCGIRGTWQGTLKFNDMRVPRENVLGGVGKGLKLALTVLNYGRCTLSAGCLGGAKVGLERAVERARHRQQFGRPIGKFHLIKQKIAQMAETVYAMDALTYLAAGLVDRHEEDLMLETATCKLFASEMAWQVADDAVQIWGGEGYLREHGLERMLRDARINRIVEGTSEVMTAFIALMGMKGVGEEFEAVLRAAKNPIGNFGRIADFARHEWRDVIVGHAGNGATRTLHPKLAEEGRMLAKLTRQLARDVSRLLARHRTDIIEQQMLLGRVTWAVTEMYAMAAVLAKLQAKLEAADADGRGRPEDLEQELTIGRGYCQHAHQRIEQRLASLSRNGDEATHKVADAVLGPL
ncbi:MAG: acyl-CoA dehydrogenase family protein [Phycisphaeraceae bacterium]